jgi:hypothetical protein
LPIAPLFVISVRYQTVLNKWALATQDEIVATTVTVIGKAKEQGMEQCSERRNETGP